MADKLNVRELYDTVMAEDFQPSVATDRTIAQIIGWDVEEIRGGMIPKYTDPDSGASHELPSFFHDYNAAMRVVPKRWGMHLHIDPTGKAIARCFPDPELGVKGVPQHESEFPAEAIVKNAIAAWCSMEAAGLT